MLEVGYWILDIGGWMFAVGRWDLGFGCWKALIMVNGVRNYKWW
jgi:hypothetical protein